MHSLNEPTKTSGEPSNNMLSEIVPTSYVAPFVFVVTVVVLFIALCATLETSGVHVWNVPGEVYSCKYRLSDSVI